MGLSALITCRTARADGAGQPAKLLCCDRENLQASLES